MRIVSRDDVVDLPVGAQLVEVLPRKEYDWAHLPGAMSVPLRQMDELAPQLLDRSRPVVTYCHDLQCDLSPRAASWLAHHGYDVADYAGGKMDWLSHGLPYEGTADLIGPYVKPVVTCLPEERVSDVAQRVDGTTMCVVVQTDGVVVGILEPHVLAVDSDFRAEEVVALGPPTVRPSEEREELDRRLKKAERDKILVSDADGRLIGVYAL